MKPLNLKLNNFGPFLNETINFSQIENNELFLISGKTGSGKTMILMLLCIHYLEKLQLKIEKRVT